jgi:hypothetical protein
VLSNVGITCGNCGSVMHVGGYNSNAQGATYLKASLKTKCFKSLSKRELNPHHFWLWICVAASLSAYIFEDLHIKILKFFY